MRFLATEFGEKNSPFTAHVIFLLQQKKREKILLCINNILKDNTQGCLWDPSHPADRHPEAKYWFLVPNWALWGNSWSVCKIPACYDHIFMWYCKSHSSICVLEASPALRSTPKCENPASWNDKYWCFQNIPFEQKECFPAIRISPKLHFLATNLLANKILPCSVH